jgi:hypothetical protein
MCLRTVLSKIPSVEVTESSTNKQLTHYSTPLEKACSQSSRKVSFSLDVVRVHCLLEAMCSEAQNSFFFVCKVLFQVSGLECRGYLRLRDPPLALLSLSARFRVETFIFIFGGPKLVLVCLQGLFHVQGLGLGFRF